MVLLLPYWFKNTSFFPRQTNYIALISSDLNSSEKDLIFIFFRLKSIKYGSKMDWKSVVACKGTQSPTLKQKKDQQFRAG